MINLKEIQTDNIKIIIIIITIIAIKKNKRTVKIIIKIFPQINQCKISINI